MTVVENVNLIGTSRTNEMSNIIFYMLYVIAAQGLKCIEKLMM